MGLPYGTQFGVPLPGHRRRLPPIESRKANADPDPTSTQDEPKTPMSNGPEIPAFFNAGDADGGNYIPEFVRFLRFNEPKAKKPIRCNEPKKPIPNDTETPAAKVCDSGKNTRSPKAANVGDGVNYNPDNEEPKKSMSKDTETSAAKKKTEKCPKNHALTQFTVGSGRYGGTSGTCDVCGRSVALGERVLNCFQCNWWKCTDCQAEAPHPHDVVVMGAGSAQVNGWYHRRKPSDGPPWQFVGTDEEWKLGTNGRPWFQKDDGCCIYGDSSLVPPEWRCRGGNGVLLYDVESDAALPPAKGWDCDIYCGEAPAPSLRVVS